MTRSPLEAFLQAAKTKKAYIEEQAEKGSRWHLFSCDHQERHGFGVMSSPHYHFDRYEMICGMEGVCVVTIEGTDYNLGPGDIVILKPGAVHGVVTESEYTAYVYLKFSPDLLRAQDSVDMHSFALYEAHSDTHLCFISHKQSGCKQIAEYLFTIYEECQRREFGYEMVVNGYICIMYACLMRLWYTSCIDNIDRINMSQSGVTILRKALDYIGKNITGELSLEAVAAHCGMSYSGFSRFFSRHMNMGFSTYVQKRKTQNSIYLLMDTDDSLSKIAEQLGFSSMAHYCACFKKYYGVTPGAYRKLHKE